jgi:hypothetical protein
VLTVSIGFAHVHCEATTRKWDKDKSLVAAARHVTIIPDNDLDEEKNPKQ